MTVEGWIARAFAMDDSAWARHANPWSVWTRVATGALLLLVVYSHVWFGWPAALALLAGVLVWTWLNPRLFPPPVATDNWASKATFGERVWIERRVRPVPRHHRLVPHLLSAAAAAGCALGLYGAVAGQPWPTVTGGLLMYAGKMWFVDRMVWLYEDVKDSDPRYSSWLRRPAPDAPAG